MDSQPTPSTPSRILDQDFGMNITTPQDFLYPMFNYGPNYFRPWRWYMQNVTNDFGSTITDEKDKFMVSLDVQQFKPNEISVKVTDKEIIIEGKHEDRQDEHGYISRQFTRRYALPRECTKDDVTSNLSSDGVLIVTAGKKAIETKEKTIPIQFCETFAKGKMTHRNVSTETDKNSKNVSTATDKNSKNVSTATDKNSKNVSTATDSSSKNASTETCKIEERMKFQGISEESIKIEESIKSDAIKKDSQLMLKEDHSRLLKPEFISSSDTVDKLIQESKKRTDELLAEMGQCSKSVIDSSALAKMTAVSEGISESLTSLSEKVGMSMSTEKAESSISEMKSYSSMSSEMMSEESSSFSSSSSTMKASGKTSEILSEIITAELREAAENL